MSDPTFKRPLTIKQGADFHETQRWGQGKPIAFVDLSGATARMQIRATIESPTALVELTTENNGIVLNTDPGRIELHLPASATALIAWTSGVYDLFITMPDGRVRKLMQGPVTVVPRITREVAP